MTKNLFSGLFIASILGVLILNSNSFMFLQKHYVVDRLLQVEWHNSDRFDGLCDMC